jgi:hypothetical protein
VTQSAIPSSLTGTSGPLAFAAVAIMSSSIFRNKTWAGYGILAHNLVKISTLES